MLFTHPSKATAPASSLEPLSCPCRRKADNGGRVLFVDDEADHLRIAELAALPHAYAVETASDGADALLKYHAARECGQPFDLIVLDVVMPGLNGLQVAEAIRAEGDCETKIAFLSGEESPILDYRANCAGAIDVWKKTDKPADIAQKVAEVVCR